MRMERYRASIPTDDSQFGVAAAALCAAIASLLPIVLLTFPIFQLPTDARVDIYFILSSRGPGSADKAIPES